MPGIIAYNWDTNKNVGGNALFDKCNLKSKEGKWVQRQLTLVTMPTNACSMYVINSDEIFAIANGRRLFRYGRVWASA